MAIFLLAAILFVAGVGAAPTVVVAPPTLLSPPTLLPTGSSTSRVTAESCEALVDSPEYSLQCSSWLGFGFCQNPDFTIFMQTHCPKMCCLAKVPTHAPQPTKSPLPPANPLLVQPTPTPNLATESEGPCRAKANTWATAFECWSWARRRLCTSFHNATFMLNSCSKSCCEYQYAITHSLPLPAAPTPPPPTFIPTGMPTSAPSRTPSRLPSVLPTAAPSSPSTSPSSPSISPTFVPTPPTTAPPSTLPSTAPPSLPPLPVPTTASPSSSPSASSDPCGNRVDQRAECFSWAKDEFCSNQQYQQFMVDKCSQSCCRYNLTCSAQRDLREECLSWAKASYCKSFEYQNFMSENCAKSCCGKGGKQPVPVAPPSTPPTNPPPTIAPPTTPPTTPPSLPPLPPAPTSSPSSPPSRTPSSCMSKTDLRVECAPWAREGYCTNQRYTAFMLDNCKRSCCSQAEEAQEQTCAAKTDNVALRDSHCTEANEQHCLEDSPYTHWMNRICSNRCCKRRETTPSPPAATISSSSRCAHLFNQSEKCGLAGYSQYCTHSSYSGWMATHCPKLCCCSSLEDKAAVCSAEGYESYCSQPRYREWMHKNCANLCCRTEQPEPAPTPKVSAIPLVAGGKGVGKHPPESSPFL